MNVDSTAENGINLQSTFVDPPVGDKRALDCVVIMGGSGGLTFIAVLDLPA